MPKRKSVNDAVDEPPRRSTRNRSSATEAHESKTQPRKAKSERADEPAHYPPPKQSKQSVSKAAEKTPTQEPPKKRHRAARKSTPGEEFGGDKVLGKTKVENDTDNVSSAANGERQYWLMKAEPETRLENGVNVRFSIDDLAAKTEPEPWDGIRAYAARNNLRAMKKGDLAFFYHSNCKEPGIVGTMEIVEEHSPDLSAHDPKAPYYDPKDKPSDPKWSVVHVKFMSKFAVPLGLKELRSLCAPGKPLENMQMLRQSRLSVSKVSPAEWQYLNELAEKKAQEAEAET